MFSEIPRCVVEESWAAWIASRKEECVSRPGAAPEEKEMALFHSTAATREIKRACLYTEEELKQPAAPRKKIAPAEGVSFF